MCQKFLETLHIFQRKPVAIFFFFFYFLIAVWFNSSHLKSDKKIPLRVRISSFHIDSVW